MAHSMTKLVMITLTECQGHMSRKKNWQYLWFYFTYRLHIWYKPNQAHSMIQVSNKVKDQGQIFPKRDKKLNNWPYLGCYFTHRLNHIYHHSFLWLIWPLPSCWENLSLTCSQIHWHLGHRIHIIVFYLGTKYEVCEWNCIRNMASFLFLYPFLG